MQGTARSLLLGSILVSAIGFSACSDDSDGGGGAGGSEAGGADKGGATATGGAKSGGASATGGTKAAGGATSNGGSGATGGKAVGGAATGGAAAGGAVAGGAANGGSAGKATGGTTPVGTAGVAGKGVAGGGNVAGNGTGGLVTAGAGGTTATAGNAGTTTTTTSSAGTTNVTTGTAGTAGSAGAASVANVINYDFEADVQGWASNNVDTVIASSTDKFVSGARSLKVNVPAFAAEDSRTISIGGSAALYPGSVITFNVWTPTGSEGLYFQAFSQSNNYKTWHTGAPPNASVTRGGWTTWTYTIPSTFPGGLQKLGLQVGVDASHTFAGGDIYIDAVTSTGAAPSCAQPGSGTAATRYDFEGTAPSDLGGWAVDTGPADTGLSYSATQASSGTQALKVAFTNVGVVSATDAITRNIYVGGDKGTVPFCGETATIKVWVPTAAASAITLKAFSQSNNWALWDAGAAPTIAPDAWTSFTYTLPTTVNALGVARLGVQFTIPAAAQPFTGDVYIDAVAW